MDTSNRSKTIKRNIVGSLGIKAISVVLNLAYVPLLIGYLGTDEYGIWIVISSTLAWINFFDIGLGNGLRNKLTEALTVKDYERSKILISTTYSIIALIFLSVSIVFVLFNNFWDWGKILNINSVPDKELSLLICVVTISFCLRFIAQLIQPILFAVHKSALASVFPVCSNLLAIILIYGLRYFEFPKLLTVSFIISVVPVISFIVGTIILFSTSIRYIKPSIKYIDFGVSKEVMTLGFNFFFIQVAANIINTSSAFIIIRILGSSYVTEYDVLYKYYMMAYMLNEIVLSPLWSAFTASLAVKDFEWSKSVLRKLNLLSFLQALGLIIMFFIADFILELWLGNKVISYSRELSLVMMLYVMLRIFLAPFVRVVNGSGKLFFSMIVSTTNCVLFVLLSVVLGKTSLGVVGIVLAACIVRIISLVTGILQVNHLLSGKTSGILSR